MSTATKPRPRVKTARKPRVKPTRTIRLVLPLNQEGKHGLFKITEGTKTDAYLFGRVPSDFGKAFEVSKCDGTDEHRYHVLLDLEGQQCQCKGFTYCGHCRHVEGLTALRNAGRI